MRDICFSPNGLLLAAAFHNSVGLWGVADGGHVATLKEHTGRVTAVAYTGDGALLVSASVDGTIRLWRDGV